MHNNVQLKIENHILCLHVILKIINDTQNRYLFDISVVLRFMQACFLSCVNF